MIGKVHPEPRDAQIAKYQVKSFYPTVRRLFTIPGNNYDKGTRPCMAVVNKQQILFWCGRLGATVWLSSITLTALLLHPYNDNPSSTRALMMVKGRKFLKLGSGCSLPSAVASMLGMTSILATNH